MVLNKIMDVKYYLKFHVFFHFEVLFFDAWKCTINIDNYSGRKTARVKISVALSNSFLFLGSRWAER